MCLGGWVGEWGVMQKRNRAAKRAKIAREMKETIQEEKKREKKKKAATTTTQSPLKVTSKTGWHKSRGGKKNKQPPPPKKKPNQTNTPFFQLDIFQTVGDKTTSKELEGSKSKRQSVSDCFMNPCRSGGSTPHQTL